jgi:hypothetical protein
MSVVRCLMWNDLKWLTCELIKTALVLIFCGFIVMLITGCSTSPVSEADVRNNQIANEARARRCRDTGGVYYDYGNGRGRCNYDPMWRGL